MATTSRDDVVELLRSRILRGLQAGALRGGDRLPSARELERELGADQRLVLEAYRQLATEDLVEMRPRSGIYVASRLPGAGGTPPLPESWIVDVLTEALSREIPAPDLHEWLRRCTETLRLRAVVVAATTDQVFGLCRELRDDYGFEAEGLVAEEIRSEATPPLSVRRADLLITTQAHESRVRQLAAEYRKPAIVIAVRPDLRAGEWALLLRRPVYAIVATPEFGEMLRRFFADVPDAAQNLRVLVFGRDDLATIPEEAPVYITQRVREGLGGIPIPGRILPAARTIATESAREIFAFVVRSNMEALGRLAH